MIRVRLEVKQIWELAVRVNLFVLEGLHRECDPLKVNDQNVWHCCHQRSLLDVNVPIASIALIFTDNISFNRLLKRLLNRVDSLNWKRQEVAVIDSVLHFAAHRADHLVAHLSSKRVTDEILSGRRL